MACDDNDEPMQTTMHDVWDLASHIQLESATTTSLRSFQQTTPPTQIALPKYRALFSHATNHNQYFSNANAMYKSASSAGEPIRVPC